jgi:hypothetical protein
MTTTTEVTTRPPHPDKPEADIEAPEVIIAAEVIEDVLNLVDSDSGSPCSMNSSPGRPAARKDREENGPFKLISFDELGDWTEVHEKQWGRIMRFKSLVIQVFTRSITNNHSKEGAAKILFMERRDGNGSGWCWITLMACQP